MKRDVGVVIAGAGRGERLGGIAKAFIYLANQPALYWVVKTFRTYPAVGPIVVVVSEQNVERAESLVQDNGWGEVRVIIGGLRRQDSVARGLKAVVGCQWVIIHDVARPLVTPTLIEEGLEAARETGAAVAAVPVTDTIKLIRDSFILETLPRSGLWSVQTPQVFRYDTIAEAYSCLEEDVTDDASLVERKGVKVKVYQGSYENIKITTKKDLVFARMLMEGRLL